MSDWYQRLATKSKGLDLETSRDHASVSGERPRAEKAGRSVRVLVANEPRAYRQAFVGSLQTLRPDAEIVEAGPEDLDQKVVELRPDLVLCSHVSSVVEETVDNWVLLYPENEPSIMIFTHGELSTVGNVDLADLVSLVDRTAETIDNDGTKSP